tara:strand:- start:4 stop:498 length:495 start_codon:yes stop_codon:yes gene_type:complete
MKKDILFYSNFCTYCKEVINNISKTPLNETMLFVCVDDENIQLPPFITSVPTIYLINEKKIVVDEAIGDWVREKLSTNTPQTQTEEIQAYYGTCGDSFGANFSSLDNTDTKPFISSYTFLGDDNGSTMAAKSDNRQQGNQSQFDSQLEKLQQSRNQEFRGITRK